MRKEGLHLIISVALLGFLFLALLKLLAESKGKTFLLIAGIILLLSSFTLLSLSHYRKKFGKQLLFFVFLFFLGIFALLWQTKGFTSLSALLFSLLGLLLQFLQSFEKPKEPHSQVFEPISPPPKKREVKEKKRDITTEEISEETSKKGFGFLGSTATRSYHQENCPVVKKIPHRKRVQFDSRLAAVEEGYHAHSCIEKYVV